MLKRLKTENNIYKKVIKEQTTKKGVEEMAEKTNVKIYPVWKKRAFDFNKQLIKERKEILEELHEPEWDRIIICLKNSFDFYFDVKELDLIVFGERGREKITDFSISAFACRLFDARIKVKKRKTIMLAVEWEALKHLENKKW